MFLSLEIAKDLEVLETTQYHLEQKFYDGQEQVGSTFPDIFINSKPQLFNYFQV